MNRRSFLSLVAAAPLVAALKPWRPDVQEYHVWLVPADALASAPRAPRFTAVGWRFHADPARAWAINKNSAEWFATNPQLLHPAQSGALSDMRVTQDNGTMRTHYFGECNISVKAGDTVSFSLDLPERRATVRVARA
jgi:hypothetical protein